MKYDIEQHGPCIEAIDWYKGQPDSRTAWEICHRGDWMLWIASRLGVSDRLLTLAKGYCAKTVMHLMKDRRSRQAVKVAIAYGEGRATKEDLGKAAEIAYAAVAEAYTAAEAYTDDDAAAEAAVAAADDDAYAAAEAAAEAAAAWKKNQQKTADICRKYLTKAVFEIIEKGV